MSDLSEVRILDYLRSGARSTAENARAFRACASVGYADCVTFMLQEGNVDVHDANDEAIRLSSNGGHVDVVRLLLAYGADPGAIDSEALRNASANGHLSVVELLLHHGAVDPGARNSEALVRARANGHADVVQALLESHLTLELPDTSLLSRFTSRFT